MWVEDEGCHDTVTSAWRDGEGDSPMGKVVEKVGRCQEKLKWWSTRCFSNITWEIAKEKKTKKQKKKQKQKRRMGEAEVVALAGNNVDL